MVQVARLAPTILASSTPLVAEFIESQRHPQGGFRDRAGNSDLYYSVFGVEAAQALQLTLDENWLLQYVRSFGNGETLDLVHVSCLARCWSAIPVRFRTDCPVEQFVDRILQFRKLDGGYDVSLESYQGTLYGSFMAVGAFQDLGYPIPHLESLGDFAEGLRDPNGGFFNSLDIPISLVPQTAGAIRLMRYLGRSADEAKAGEYLLSCFHPQGGFCASSFIPIPDLLSTATSLHALDTLKIDLGPASELCLDFVDSLWTNKGGFYGQWEDTHADVEYTYYALLALGHLSLLSSGTSE